MENKCISFRHGFLCFLIKKAAVPKIIALRSQMRNIASVSKEMPPSMLFANIQIPA